VGNAKANRREPSSWTDWVFNFKAVFVMNVIAWDRQARPHLLLKTQPRFFHLSLSLSMTTAIAIYTLLLWLP
jgi:hypothetical protein